MRILRGARRLLTVLGVLGVPHQTQQVISRLGKRRDRGQILCILEGHAAPLEIETQFLPARTGELGIILRTSSDGMEQTRIVYQAQQQQLVIEYCSN